ncbi:MAG: hypothetical protein K9G67_10110 [Bacteroidales bacterium]|nr:hypothetical protein [Bacteroidales bacterium]MCF8344860.1 hypothetical protein [Bacteroidales bacterium]MCF8349956.1 hypothetical protein [Bacteroidales bacterium]MCF8376698.1 hypothetical protein [Bacteroidales bacterium]
MSIKFENAVLMVESMELTKAFYCDVLDQKVRLDFGGALIFESGLSLWEITSDHIIPEKMGKEGMTEEEVAERTSVPLEKVRDIVGR